jgi:hypothetical protein
VPRLRAAHLQRKVLPLPEELGVAAAKLKDLPGDEQFQAV